MTEFILNEKPVAVSIPAGTTLLDYIRYHQHLPGTKIGCREGDCGACTILIGDIRDNELRYTSATSCLMPIGNAQGCHIVTIEGINPGSGGDETLLTPVQQAMAAEGATQCGFCTPGFVMSLTGSILGNGAPSVHASIDGNICRCTGYKSIQRAAAEITKVVSERKEDDTIGFAIGKGFVPPYFSGIKNQLIQIRSRSNGQSNESMEYVLGGGTDLYVQKPEELQKAGIRFLLHPKNKHPVVAEGEICHVAASATVTDLKESPLLQEIFPGLHDYMQLVSSTPIRNMATLGGNFINASPIGDLTIFFLALNADITLEQDGRSRTVALHSLYKGYKLLDKKPGEILTRISFRLTGKESLFNFEKVSKRTNLDIASVNTAIHLRMNKNKIERATVSAGGVAPVPKLLQQTGAFLSGKNISEELVKETVQIASTEISPISDTRGSAAYKKFLLGQLIKGHFIKLFPELDALKILQPPSGWI